MYKAILFSIPYITKYNPKTGATVSCFVFLQEPSFPNSCGHSKICTSTGHRLVWGIFGACLMALSKGTFWWHCKMLDKVLNRAKRREGHYITLCTVLYLTLSCRSLPPYNLTEYPDFSTCPTGLFCHMCRRSLRKKLLSLTTC